MVARLSPLRADRPPSQESCDLGMGLGISGAGVPSAHGSVDHLERLPITARSLRGLSASSEIGARGRSTGRLADLPSSGSLRNRITSGASSKRTLRLSKSGSARGEVLRMLLAGLADRRTDGLDLDRFLPCSCGKSSETRITAVCLRGGLVCGGGVEGFFGTREAMESGKLAVVQDLSSIPKISLTGKGSRRWCLEPCLSQYSTARKRTCMKAPPEGEAGSWL